MSTREYDIGRLNVPLSSSSELSAWLDGLNQSDPPADAVRAILDWQIHAPYWRARCECIATDDPRLKSRKS